MRIPAIEKGKNYSIIDIDNVVWRAVGRNAETINVPVHLYKVINKNKMPIMDEPSLWETGGESLLSKEGTVGKCIIVGDVKGKKINKPSVIVSNPKANGTHALCPIKVGSKVVIGKKTNNVEHLLLFEVADIRMHPQPELRKNNALAVLKKIGFSSGSLFHDSRIEDYPAEYSDIIEAAKKKINILNCKEVIYAKKWDYSHRHFKFFKEIYINPNPEDFNLTLNMISSDKLEERLMSACKGDNDPFRPIAVEFMLQDKDVVRATYKVMSCPNKDELKSTEISPLVVEDYFGIDLNKDNYGEVDSDFLAYHRNLGSLIKTIEKNTNQYSRPSIFGLIHKGYKS
jgi:hypothetical protein